MSLRLLSPLRQLSGGAHSRLSRRTFFNFASPFGSGPTDEHGMITHRVVNRINATPQMMFDIVSDVSRYREFVPFVEESFINSRDPTTNQPTEAGLRVGWKQFDEKFVCKLTCEQDKRVVAESISISLFHNLHTEWTFKSVATHNANQDHNCEIDLVLKYKFKNPLYNTISSIFQDQVTHIMLKAFTNRAMQLKLQRKFRGREANFDKLS